MAQTLDLNTVGALTTAFSDQIQADSYLNVKYYVPYINTIKKMINDFVSLVFCTDDDTTKQDLKQCQDELRLEQQDIVKFEECMDKALQSVNIEKSERANIRNNIDAIEKTLVSDDRYRNVVNLYWHVENADIHQLDKIRILAVISSILESKNHHKTA